MPLLETRQPSSAHRPGPQHTPAVSGFLLCTSPVPKGQSQRSLWTERPNTEMWAGESSRLHGNQLHVKHKRPESKVSLPPSLHLCRELPRQVPEDQDQAPDDPGGLPPCMLQMLLASYIFHLFQCMWFGANKSKVIFVSLALPSIFRDCISTKASKM